MRPIRTVLADDNIDSLDITDFFVSQLQEFEIVAKCKNGEELFDQVFLNKPDLVLVDINMPILNGIESIKKCLEIDPQLQFIFITSYDEFAAEAFNLSAIDYVVKPIEKSRLIKALVKAIKKIQRDTISSNNESAGCTMKRLMVKFNGSVYFILQEEIIFIEKQGKKCIIYTIRDTIETYDTLGNLYVQLDDSIFFMSHRSYVINLNMVSHITPKNETYLIYFYRSEYYAHLSKLKYEEFQKKISNL